MSTDLVPRELPLLPPIRTTGIGAKPLELLEGNNEPIAGVEEEDEEAASAECVTPKTEQHVLKQVLVCPPAPRKPRPVKRKLAAAAPPKVDYFQVPVDLASVFIPLSFATAKKIRVV